MSITFKDLENFLVTADSKTLSEASEKLGIAQPSLSLAIQKLEKELGQILFIRSRDGVKVTPHAKTLLPQAQNAMELLRKIKGQTAKVKYRIGCHPSVGIFVLGEFLKLIATKLPDYNFEIINASSNEINKMVAQGLVDFGLVMNPLQIQGLIIKNIGHDEVCIWEAKNRYSDKMIYNPQMLQAHSILSRFKGSTSDTIEVQNLELLAHLVASGAGYGIIPSQVVKFQNVSLKIVPGTPTFTDTLSLTCYPEMIKSADGKLIFEILKKSFKEID